MLQCTSAYPAPYEDLNLGYIDILRKKLNLETGFSDHSRGIEASIASVVFAPKIIEKHITLNNNDIGPDHKASLEQMIFRE